MIPPRRRWYRGVWYRSTLEADWAATLHHLGITAEYEPEAYQTPEGVYSPDFWIPAQKVWLEVKGPHGERVDKAEAFANLLAVAHEQYGWTDYGGVTFFREVPGQPILVFGLPSQAGKAVIRPASCFGSYARFNECGRCRRVVIMLGLVGTCPLCGYRSAADFVGVEIPFRRARDDDAPRAG